MGLTVKDSEIEGEQDEDEDKKGYPDDHHGLQALVVVSLAVGHVLLDVPRLCSTG